MVYRKEALGSNPSSKVIRELSDRKSRAITLFQSAYKDRVIGPSVLQLEFEIDSDPSLDEAGIINKINSGVTRLAREQNMDDEQEQKFRTMTFAAIRPEYAQAADKAYTTTYLEAKGIIDAIYQTASNAVANDQEFDPADITEQVNSITEQLPAEMAEDLRVKVTMELSNKLASQINNKETQKRRDRNKIILDEGIIAGGLAIRRDPTQLEGVMKSIDAQIATADLSDESRAELSLSARDNLLTQHITGTVKRFLNQPHNRDLMEGLVSQMRRDEGYSGLDVESIAE